MRSRGKGRGVEGTGKPTLYAQPATRIRPREVLLQGTVIVPEYLTILIWVVAVTIPVTGTLRVEMQLSGER